MNNYNVSPKNKYTYRKNNFKAPHNFNNSNNINHNINSYSYINGTDNTNNSMNDFMQNFSNMINNNQIPDNIKNILNNMMQNTNNETTNNSDPNFTTSSSRKNTNTSNNTSTFNNFDMNTIFRIQNLMNSINNDKQNESRTNLLLSLKPYLKESRREKVDQYIQLMKMEKIFEAINPLENNTGGDKKNV